MCSKTVQHDEKYNITGIKNIAEHLILTKTNTDLKIERKKR